MANMVQVPDHYTIQYETNWQMLLQQQESRLKGRTRITAQNGASVRVNQMDSTSMTAVTNRYGATDNKDIALPARWVFPNPYETSSVFDEYDDKFLGSVVLPTSETMQSQIAAYNRTCDQVLIDALTGAASETTPTTSLAYQQDAGDVVAVALPSSQIILPTYGGAGSPLPASGMSLGKLIKAKQILDTNEAPSEDRVLIVSAKEISDLLQTTEVTNSLYNTIRALVAGEIDQFLGFTVVRSELLPQVGDNRSCIAYQKSAVMLVDGGKRSYMDILPTMRHALQIRTTASMGAARLLEKAVVKIQCDVTMGSTPGVPAGGAGG